MKVDTQHYEIKVQIMEDGTKNFNERRDDLVEESKLAEKLNEDLKQQSKAQDEISDK